MRMWGVRRMRVWQQVESLLYQGYQWFQKKIEGRKRVTAARQQKSAGSCCFLLVRLGMVAPFFPAIWNALVVSVSRCQHSLLLLGCKQSNVVLPTWNTLQLKFIIYRVQILPKNLSKFFLPKIQVKKTHHSHNTLGCCSAVAFIIILPVFTVDVWVTLSRNNHKLYAVFFYTACNKHTTSILQLLFVYKGSDF